MEDNKDTEKVEKVEETTEKTYTKEDLDNSFNAGVKKANSEWQKDEKYKEFLEWKKTSQNDSEKLKELQDNNNELKNKINDLQASLVLKDSEVKKDFERFVKSEVIGLVDETTNFDEALKKFKKDNPQYFGEVQIKKVQSSPNLNGGTGKPKTTSDIMNSFLRSK